MVSAPSKVALVFPVMALRPIRHTLIKLKSLMGKSLVLFWSKLNLEKNKNQFSIGFCFICNSIHFHLQDLPLCLITKGSLCVLYVFFRDPCVVLYVFFRDPCVCSPYTL
jgi:hypothetical protein